MRDEQKLDFLDSCFDDDFCTDEHFAVLRELACDPEPYIRGQAACVTLQFIHVGAKDLLLQLAHDTDALVRTEAYDSLSAFPYDDVAQCLAEAVLHEPDGLARSYAVLSWADVRVALGRDGSEGIALAHRLMAKESSPYCQLSLYYALHRFGDSEGLSGMLAFLRHDDYHLRCAAISSLYEILDAANRNGIYDAVRKLAESEPTEAVRSAAARYFS